MNTAEIRNVLFARCLTVSLALLFFVWPALCADKPKAPPSSKPAAPAKASNPAAKPGGAGAAKSGSPTTASHGPTTTTAGHPTTTTTTGHSPTTTTAGHGTTTTTAGHTTTTPAASHTTTPGSSGRTFGTAGGAKGPAAAGGKAPAPARTQPTPRGSTSAATRNGGTVTRRADGKVASFHDPKRGMEVHRGLDGNRRVVVERPDHSRIVAERGGRGYVQRPYMYHGHEYARRSYYYHGRYYHAYYGRYYYRGVYVNPYYPAYYYPRAYYGWVYNPWVAPVPYAWGWGGNPWYGYYGAYFTPYPVYASAPLWLTDYLIANSLQAAYQARLDGQAQTRAQAADASAPLTPEVKQLIADEVKRQVALENSEAQAGAANGEPDAASSSIQRALTDGAAHVFVAGHNLDVVDAGGTECVLSEGDALQLAGQTAPDATNVSLTVLASKGGRECAKGDIVAVSLTDLQDMQNHMRETIDQGMQELQKKQGQGGLPAAPAAAQAAPVETAMAAIAPPPPPEKEVAAEINQQSQEADRAETEAAGDTAGAGTAAGGAPAAETPTIEIGQTVDQVTAALGQPARKADLGTKKIYIYKDMKITFVGGKVSDVQ